MPCELPPLLPEHGKTTKSRPVIANVTTIRYVDYQAGQPLLAVQNVSR